MSKGKLGLSDGGKRVHLDAMAEGSLATTGGAPVPLRMGVPWTYVIKVILGSILSILTLTVILYLILAGTLMRAIPNGDKSFTWVQSSTFVGGVPEPGNTIYASIDKPPNNSFGGRIMQTTSGVDDGSILMVLAGPYGDVATLETGELILDGKPTDYFAAVETQYLNKAYVTVCIKYHCTPGDIIIIPQDNIIGEANNVILSSGHIIDVPKPTSVGGS